MSPQQAASEMATTPRFGAKALVFDLDGTLVHSGPDLAAACNRMLATLGFEQYKDRVVFDWLGNGARRLVERALTGKIETGAQLAEALSLELSRVAAARR